MATETWMLTEEMIALECGVESILWLYSREGSHPEVSRLSVQESRKGAVASWYTEGREGKLFQAADSPLSR